jgi:probable rRNA maturation factor
LVIFKKKIAGLTELALDRFIVRVRRSVGLRDGVNVLITSSAEMKSLNRRFRGKDSATDVLSFPALPVVNGAERPSAGDIAISADIANENARLLGHGAGMEIKVLVLHGILHLRGFDHENKNDRGRMARREARLRLEFRLPTGLIERVASSRRRRRT